MHAAAFGLTSGHDAGHMHRAVMEGVAFAAKRNLAVLERKAAASKALSPRPGAHATSGSRSRRAFTTALSLCQQKQSRRRRLRDDRRHRGRGGGGSGGSAETLVSFADEILPIRRGATAICATPNFSTRAINRTARYGGVSTRSMQRLGGICDVPRSRVGGN